MNSRRLLTGLSSTIDLPSRPDRIQAIVLQEPWFCNVVKIKETVEITMNQSRTRPRSLPIEISIAIDREATSDFTWNDSSLAKLRLIETSENFHVRDDRFGHNPHRRAK